MKEFIKKGRRDKLIDFLENLPEDKLVMEHFISEKCGDEFLEYKGDEDPVVGLVEGNLSACVFGWLPVVFPQDWKFYRDSAGNYDVDHLSADLEREQSCGDMLSDFFGGDRYAWLHIIFEIRSKDEALIEIKRLA